MNRKYLAIYLAVMPVAAFAQGDNSQFLAAPKAGGLIVMNRATGATSDVLLSSSGARPENCAPGRFYTADRKVLVDCDDGTQFELAPAAGVPTGFKVLKPIGGPNDTDDPGPSFKQQ